MNLNIKTCADLFAALFASARAEPGTDTYIRLYNHFYTKFVNGKLTRGMMQFIRSHIGDCRDCKLCYEYLKNFYYNRRKKDSAINANGGNLFAEGDEDWRDYDWISGQC